MPYRYRGCRKFFSVKTGTVIADSKLGFQNLAIAIYLFNTNIKGTSSMKLNRNRGISQKSAWHRSHRIRETWADKQNDPFAADETYIGCKARNMHAKIRRDRIHGRAGQGCCCRCGGPRYRKSRGELVASTDRYTLQGFVTRHTVDGAEVFTGEAGAYRGCLVTRRWCIRLVSM